MNLPPDIQRNVATFTTEGGLKARTGNRLFGSERRIGDDMRQCICGICARTRNTPQTSCTLMADGGMKVVERKQTELCKPICLSKSSVSMLQRFIRSLLREVALMQTGPYDYIQITLQRDDATYEASTPESEMPPSTKPYLFDARFADGELDLAFFAKFNSEPYLTLPYNIGDSIDLASVMRPNIFRRLRQLLDAALIEGDGRKYSLVIVANNIPEQDFELYGIRFRYVENFAFRARPLYLFIQAQPKTRMAEKGHYAEL